ncbi:MAG: TatD family hydrolase [Candidatus Zambryskibacteria bacterium]
MKYIDIHCHLDYFGEGEERDGVLARMKEEGVGTITVGADLKRSKRAVEIAEANENVWATIGIHPNYNDDAKKLEKLIDNPKVVGIGECGLDYFRMEDPSEKAKQKILFEEQIQLAIKYDKPLMLHVRDARPNGSSGRAYDDALNILENYKREAGSKLRGNIHFFAGNVEIAKKFLDLDFTASFTGVITFTHDYDEVIKYIPQNSIMSETDAPFVAPVPFRGKKGEPAQVIYVVEKMAEIRGEDADVLNSAIIQNFKRVFDVSCA